MATELEAAAQQPTEEGNVYDLLKGLRKEFYPHAVHLFGLAATAVMPYFFIKSSADYLNGKADHPILDENGTLIGQVSYEEIQFARMSVLPERFWAVVKDGDKYSIQDPEIPHDQVLILWALRGGIMRRLENEGQHAAEEFALFASEAGADLDSLAETTMSRIQKLLDERGSE